MIAVEVVPDRFSTANQKTANGLSSEREPGANSSVNHIRRPTNGIQLKQDSFATLRVVAGNGNPVTVVDAGSRRKDNDQKFFEINGKRATDIYSNFFISSIQEERAEKSQVLETFGEPYIFLFGERARVMNFTGTLMNTADFNWEAEWWYNYDNYLRGSACVQNDARVFLAFDDTLVSGYIISSAATKSAEMPYYVNFQFQMFITSYTNISQRLGNPDAYPVGSIRLNRVSAAEINAARPTLLLPGAAPVESSIAGDQFTGPLDSFFDAISSGVDAIGSAISSILPNIRFGMSDLSNLLNGVIVRVPIGFEGDLVYDETRDVTYVSNDPQGGVITFSTFDQNEAEYVGSTSHYGSSIQGSGVVRYDFSAGADDSSLRFTGFDRQAKAIWAANGFEVPDSYLSPVTAMLIVKGIGIVSAGASKAWQKKGNLADKFTAGLQGAGDATLLQTGLGDKYTTAQQTLNFGPTDASAPVHPTTPLPAPPKPPPHALPVARHLGKSDIENASS